jgi:hypothetical protein
MGSENEIDDSRLKLKPPHNAPCIMHHASCSWRLATGDADDGGSGAVDEVCSLMRTSRIAFSILNQVQVLPWKILAAAWTTQAVATTI